MGKKSYAAENLFAGYLRKEGWAVHQTGVKRSGPPGRKPGNDFFGAFDIVAFKIIDHAVIEWWIQVTTQEGRSGRRRRIDSRAWPSTWRVSLVSHETVPEPANRSLRRHFFKIEDYDTVSAAYGAGNTQKCWKKPEAVEVNWTELQDWMKLERQAARVTA
jgi:hypothetical protein